ncbi:hypothetical protein C8R46DRAFT_640535 [Mycena filopes]|nr:hypothetical protein C8R46DRAFT_640535 [Mycena filopes]
MLLFTSQSTRRRGAKVTVRRSGVYLSPSYANGDRRQPRDRRRTGASLFGLIGIINRVTSLSSRPRKDRSGLRTLNVDVEVEEAFRSCTSNLWLPSSVSFNALKLNFGLYVERAPRVTACQNTDLGVRPRAKLVIYTLSFVPPFTFSSRFPLAE